jgi:hypothetical protein
VKGQSTTLFHWGIEIDDTLLLIICLLCRTKCFSMEFSHVCLRSLWFSLLSLESDLRHTWCARGRWCNANEMKSEKEMMTFFMFYNS